jgi:hypothetical protein
VQNYIQQALKRQLSRDEGCVFPSYIFALSGSTWPPGMGGRYKQINSCFQSITNSGNYIKQLQTTNHVSNNQSPVEFFIAR